MSTEPLLIQALRHQPLERPPVWLMRQAGRYLSEYRALKEQYSFLELCKSVELALQVTLQPIEILDVDAAIIFADILLPLEPMGINLEFNPGPKIHNPIRQANDVQQLKVVDNFSRLQFVFDLVAQARQELEKLPGEPKATIGFAGAPWTLASYLIDQGPVKHFLGTQIFAEERPQAFHDLMEKLTLSVSGYLLEQVANGAQAIQLFDTWGGNLSAKDYRRFALPYTQKIIHAVRNTGTPCVLYLNGASHLLDELLESGADCLSIDWRSDLGETEGYVVEKSQREVALQGNLNPTLLFQSQENLAQTTREMLARVKRRKSYIVNLGHGVLPTTPRENVVAFVEQAKKGWPE